MAFGLIKPEKKKGLCNCENWPGKSKVHRWAVRKGGKSRALDASAVHRGSFFFWAASALLLKALQLIRAGPP